MLYRGIEYSVVQGIERHLRKWAATASGIEISGRDSTRDEAISNAEKAIDRAIQKQRFKQDLDGENQWLAELLPQELSFPTALHYLVGDA